MEKLIIITGVSSGIGEATANLLLKKGCRVIGLSRRDPVQIKKCFPDNFFWHFCDFSLPDSIPNLCQNNLSKYGKIDIFINCAAESHFSKLIDIDDKLIKRLIEINLTSPLLLVKNIIPMMEQGGQIIFVTSSAAKIPSPLISVYAALKSAQESIADSLNIEYTDLSIKFKILRPGLTTTDFPVKSGVPHEEISKNLSQSPEQVAGNLIKLIRSRKKIKNSGGAKFIIPASIFCKPLLFFMIKNKYLKRIKRLSKKI